MKTVIIRAIRRFRRRFPVSFRLIREGKEHVHKNPPRRVVLVEIGRAHV